MISQSNLLYQAKPCMEVVSDRVWVHLLILQHRLSGGQTGTDMASFIESSKLLKLTMAEFQCHSAQVELLST